MKSISFPHERLVGYLHSSVKGVPGFHGRFKKSGELLDDVENDEWTLVGPAQGPVQVPEQQAILLEVLPDEARDLSFIANIAPHALQAIWLGNTQVDDQQLKALATLGELEWLDVQNNGNITDEGMSVLSSLPQLKHFGAHWTRISDNTLERLALCSELEYVDVWGCQVSEGAVRQLQNALPHCKIRTE